MDSTVSSFLLLLLLLLLLLVVAAAAVVVVVKVKVNVSRYRPEQALGDPVG
jgi:hypothetical protein